MVTVLVIACAAIAFQTLPNVADGAEAMSLSGEPLRRPSFDADTRDRLQADLQTALENFEGKPTDVDAIVWVGRRLGYLGRYRDAIEWFSQQLQKRGPNAKFLRHRGHRYISIREFERAVADFEHASRLIDGTEDEVEPDGVPNERNQPISSLHSNVWYHLALTRDLLGDFDGALAACDEGMSVSGNPDRLVSQTYWRYLILRRLGRDEDAMRALKPINAELDLIENHSYVRLLLVYKGELSVDSVMEEATGAIESPTTAFGLGAFFHLEGDAKRAKEFFERATAGTSWPAFGFIAGEAELMRMQMKDEG